MMRYYTVPCGYWAQAIFPRWQRFAIHDPSFSLILLLQLITPSISRAFLLFFWTVCFSNQSIHATICVITRVLSADMILSVLIIIIVITVDWSVRVDQKGWAVCFQHRNERNGNEPIDSKGYKLHSLEYVLTSKHLQSCKKPSKVKSRAGSTPVHHNTEELKKVVRSCM